MMEILYMGKEKVVPTPSDLTVDPPLVLAK